MKRIISLILAGVLVLSGCVQLQGTAADDYTMLEAETEGRDFSEFEGLNDAGLMRYVEDNIYSGLVEELDSDKYFVENVSTVYVSQEYIDELAFNSQSNVYFGYTLAELDEAFQGTRYVFSLGDEGETVVAEFEAYDDTFENVIKNVAVGTGVILVCVTVSVVTGGAGAPAVSMIFAASAETGAIFAVSSGALSGVMAGVTTGIQSQDMEQAMKAAALAGSESFKWGAITGVISGGASEAKLINSLKGATKNGLTLKEAAAIQKESKYPVDVIKQFHTKEEYEVFKAANLKPYMVNGQTALVRPDIDLSLVDEFGHTNLQRMELGKAPLDVRGKAYELHHIGQKADATLAILTQAEHDNPVIHGFITMSEIKRSAFKKQRQEFWKTMATIFGRRNSIMGDFVKVLKQFDDFCAVEGVGKAAVKEAETMLALKFAEEYAQYLKECGVASADGHEFTGLVKSKRLNVVDVTEAMRKKKPNMPADMYVVEELQIDGIVIWQSGDGKVYGTARDGKPELISSSLADYVMQDD